MDDAAMNDDSSPTAVGANPVAARSDAVRAWDSLFRAQVAVMRRIGVDFPREGTSVNEYDVLNTLSSQPGESLRLRELNSKVLLNQSSVSRLVDRLAARNLVTKSRDPEDARGTVVTLTAAGHRLYRRIAAAHSATIARTMQPSMSAEDLDALRRLCDRLRNSLDD